MHEKEIPIENIYHMLCYSWSRLESLSEVNVEEIGHKTIPNLLAGVLISQLNRIIKKGLYREYINYEDNLSFITGKLDFQKNIRENRGVNTKFYCQYNEFSINTLMNQVIKSTLYKLIQSEFIDEKRFKEDIIRLYHKFNGIDLIEINSIMFSKIKIHRNNWQYGLLISICKLFHENILMSENNGKYIFKDFLKDEKQMAIIFEEFVRNFYKFHLKNYTVSRETITWKLKVMDGDNNLIPQMQTDIVLENKDHKIILDTKFYKNALSINFQREKFISGNLYQIYSYIGNSNYLKDKKLIGVLIYPEILREIDFESLILGTPNKIMIKTLNLNQNWKRIEKRLLDIVNTIERENFNLRDNTFIKV